MQKRVTAFSEMRWGLITSNTTTWQDTEDTQHLQPNPTQPNPTSSAHFNRVHAMFNKCNGNKNGSPPKASHTMHSYAVSCTRPSIVNCCWFFKYTIYHLKWLMRSQFQSKNTSVSVLGENFLCVAAIIVHYRVSGVANGVVVNMKESCCMWHNKPFSMNSRIWHHWDDAWVGRGDNTLRTRVLTTPLTI